MGTKSPSLKLTNTCRGMGKIYSRIQLDGCPSDAVVTAQSQLDDGTVLPVTLRRVGQARSWVLVLAVLEVAQQVHIQVADKDGTPLLSAVRSVSPRAARMSSQVHTLLRDTRIEAIRNCDALPAFGSYAIELIRVVRVINQDDVFQVQLTGSFGSREEACQETEVVLLDRQGMPLPPVSRTIIRDTVSDDPRAEGCATRTITVTFRVPRDLDSCVAWARCRQGETWQTKGFVTFEDFTVRHLREVWDGFARPAAMDDAYRSRFATEWDVAESALELQRRTKLTVDPKFSVVVPLYHTPVAYLDEMAASVVRQSYANLELVLVNASPEDRELRQAIDRWMQEDGRIKVVELARNEGISLNTRAGIEAATGDYVGFLDHDDALAPDALYRYAEAIEQNPDIDFLYSDEDHWDGNSYYAPYFKPDWEPDLLLGANYICHFFVLKASLLEQVELPSADYDGAQDYYLALMASAKATRIYHCPRILYHWRVHPGSTAQNIQEKPYTVEAGRRAIQAYLDAHGIDAVAKNYDPIPGRYWVDYRIQEHPLVSVIIPNKDAVPVLDRCLRSLIDKTDYDNYEVIVVENNSTDDETFAYYRTIEAWDSRIRVVYYQEQGFNYPKLNNFGVSHAQGDYLLLLNNDTEILDSGWMRRMLSLCMRPSTGIVGAKLLFPDGTIQHAGIMTTPTWGPAHMNLYRDGKAGVPSETIVLTQDVSAVTGACLMTRRSVYEEVGGLDPEFEVDYNDVDFCFKVGKAGYLVVFDPHTVLYHYESVSRGFHQSDASKLRFERERGLLRYRWPERYAFADPAVNENYNRDSVYFNLPPTA